MLGGIANQTATFADDEKMRGGNQILVWPRPPSSVTKVGHMADLVKVSAKNDVENEVHYRALGSADKTLCGMDVADGPLKNEMSCARCHQFASGKI